jgi:polysaccharide export outer membrane protein
MLLDSGLRRNDDVVTFLLRYLFYQGNKSSTMTFKYVFINWALCFILCLSFALQDTRTALAQDYLLGGGDVVTVSVYEQPDMDTTVRVSGDGMISIPLLGQISAENLSTKQLEEKIELLLADGYIVEPQVHIFIKEFRSRKVTILGEVKSPGIYEIQGQITILELISKANGLTGDAAYQAIIQNKNKPETLSPVNVVDLTRLMKEGQTSQNVDIVDGDHVYIPKKEVFYVSGQVKKPGVYNYEQDLTVIKALTMAGGPTDKAAPDRTRIIRTKEGREHLIKGVRMDIRVLPNDVIMVPESYF